MSVELMGENDFFWKLMVKWWDANDQYYQDPQRHILIGDNDDNND